MKQTIHCKVIRNVYTNANKDFSIFGCIPAVDDAPKVHLNKYGNFTLKGDLSLMEVGNDYTIEVEERTGNYGYEYWLVGFPDIVDFDIGDVSDITSEQELEMLKSIMTPSQAEYVHEAYPNFIRLVVNGEEDKIDYKKIRNVAEVRLQGYVNKVNQRFKFYRIHIDYAPYNLSFSECSSLCNEYHSIKGVHKVLDENPYKVLIEVLGRDFNSVDRLICDNEPKWEVSKERCLYLACYLLECNEQDGNTRINGNELAQVIAQYEPKLNEHIVEVAKESGKIHFDEGTKDLSLMSTYRDECHIAEEVKRKIKEGTKWKIDTKKYCSNGDITLSDEQTRILTLLCEHDIAMLIGSSGCVDAETEFFNGTQWKKISEYQAGDKVLQYNLNGTAELVYPEKYIKEPCNEMYHFETKYGLNQTLTKDHRVVYYSKKGCLHNDSLEEVMKNHEQNICGFNGNFITSFRYGSKGIDLTDIQIRIMCAVIADGSFYSVAKPHQSSYQTCRFHVKKECKKERLKALFNEAQIEYREVQSANEGYTDFYIQAPRREKEFTDYWYNCTNEQLKIICDEVMFWDGSVNPTKNGIERKRFSTSIEQTANFIQFAFTACGYRASLSMRDRRGKEYKTAGKTYIRKAREYNVSITNRNLIGLYKRHNKDIFQKVTPVDGYKYCFTVPSHMLVLRRKNQIFITGNSGKSSSVRAIVDLLEDNNKTFTLLAPSGIAAKRLRETTGREASTIHKRLANGALIDTDVVVVDEVSMVDVHLFSELLYNIDDYTKLILVFDSAQLASISCGNLVQDLMNSEIVPCAKLTKVFRYGVGGIATVGTDARNGKDYLTKQGRLNCENASKIKDYRFVQVGDNPLTQLMEEYAKVRKLYEPKDILILTPYNKGAFGTYAINEAIQRRYNPIQGIDNFTSRQLPKSLGTPVDVLEYHIGDKVINKKNNYHALTPEGFEFWLKSTRLSEEIDRKKVKAGGTNEDILTLEDELFELNLDAPSEATIYNGDIGFIRDITPQGHIYVQFDEQMIVFRKSDLQNLLLAYACTSHASQGCEAKAVIFLTHPSQKKMLSRNLCYMSLTRAKELLVEIGDIDTISHALTINETFLRKTWLKELLTGEENVK